MEPPTKRPLPWSAMIAGVFIAALSGWFFYELNLAPEPPTGTKPSSAPILGLNDEATKRSEEDVGRNRPPVQACASPKPGQPPACKDGQRDFCDGDGQHLACCPLGMVALPGKAAQVACACAPGGATNPAGESASCARAGSYDGVAQRGIEAKLDRLRLCRIAALKRSSGAPATLQLGLRVAPDGAVFQAEVSTKEADAGFKECVVSWVETVKLAPPPDGDHAATIVLDLASP